MVLPAAAAPRADRPAANADVIYDAPPTRAEPAPRQTAPRGYLGGGLIESMVARPPAASPVEPVYHQPRRYQREIPYGWQPEDPYGEDDYTPVPRRGYAPRQPEPYADPYAEPDYRQPPATRNPYAADPAPSGPVRRVESPHQRRTIVDYPTRQAPGTIVIDTKTRFLYLVQPGGTAIRYGVGVGRPGFGWKGTKTITMKREWPDWRPPAEMRRRRPDLPVFMPGGPANPLGARALYLGSSLYRIHGSNEPETIGYAVSSGCFRMLNDDVVDLYRRVRVGTRVVVI